MDDNNITPLTDNNGVHDPNMLGQIQGYNNLGQYNSPENMSPGSQALPMSASDTDLIEKEWVNLLEHITHKYAEDPYTQQIEISKIKSDYIKKRYGKDIKQGEN